MLHSWLTLFSSIIFIGLNFQSCTVTCLLRNVRNVVMSIIGGHLFQQWLRRGLAICVCKRESVDLQIAGFSYDFTPFFLLFFFLILFDLSIKKRNKEEYSCQWSYFFFFFCFIQFYYFFFQRSTSRHHSWLGGQFTIWRFRTSWTSFQVSFFFYLWWCLCWFCIHP